VLHASAQVWSAQPNGLPGNDDAGTMSAWYVLTAIGLYQAQPGAPARELSSPFFDSVTVNASGSGRPALRILAPGAGPTAEYIANATLDAKPLTRAWLTPGQVRSGKVLRFTLQAGTGSTWATAPSGAPPSLSTKDAT
jgi:putative alpha-1,2-mannosidase